MATPRIHHVQIAIPAGGEAAAQQFYGGQLGLMDVPKPAHLQGRGGVWFATGNLQLHLGVDAAFRPATKAHVAFQVTGLDALRERLEAAGYGTTEDEPLAGYHRCYVQDPFGNRVELLEDDGLGNRGGHGVVRISFIQKGYVVFASGAACGTLLARLLSRRQCRAGAMPKAQRTDWQNHD